MTKVTTTAILVTISTTHTMTWNLTENTVLSVLSTEQLLHKTLELLQNLSIVLRHFLPFHRSPNNQFNPNTPILYHRTSPYPLFPLDQSIKIVSDYLNSLRFLKISNHPHLKHPFPSRKAITTTTTAVSIRIPITPIHNRWIWMRKSNIREVFQLALLALHLPSSQFNSITHTNSILIKTHKSTNTLITMIISLLAFTIIRKIIIF